MPRDLSRWAQLFHRAAESEIGISITLDTHPDLDLITSQIHPSRPPGFEDYTVAIPSIPKTIYIVKPGVTLD
jgi:hypothetical protein